jgi:recombination protein RecA
VLQNVAGLFAGRSTQGMSVPTTLDYKEPADVPVLPTGLRPLDKALGLGGLPYGHITELIGSFTAPLSNGPISVAARIASRAQRKQQRVSIIDLSRDFDPWHAERCGLVAPQLLLTRPDTAFAALTSLENAGRQEGLVIVSMGVVTDLLSQAEPEQLKALLRRLRRIVKSSTSVFLFMTLLRNDDPFDPAHYPAGFPLASIADVRLWIQDETWTHQDGLATAYKATLTVIKNDLAVAGIGADVKIKFAA